MVLLAMVTFLLEFWFVTVLDSHAGGWIMSVVIVCGNA